MKTNILKSIFGSYLPAPKEAVLNAHKVQNKANELQRIPITKAYEKPMFDGATFDKNLDQDRLTSQLIQVKNIMLDGEWRTLQEIHRLVAKGSESSCAARIRDLRKQRFGGYTIESRRLSGGTYQYRLVKK
jgi:hypothetical protein